MRNSTSTLFVSSLVASSLVASAAAAQDWATATPLYGSPELTSGFMPDPQVIAVTAGGADLPSTIGAPEECLGRITAAQPDVRLTFTPGEEGLPLRFFVLSETDTTLIINAADGSWHCNDDGADENSGLNPVIQFDTPSAGQYDVWIGVFGDEAAVGSANLSITELTSVTPASQAQAAVDGGNE